MGWAVMDGDKMYIDVVYDSEKEARATLRDLLKPYPKDHFWRERLSIREVSKNAVKPKAVFSRKKKEST